jgi:diphthamide biosynthesis protein 7
MLIASTSNDIITSLSSGHLSHLTPTPTGYTTTSTWSAHTYEPWICAFDAWDPNRIWSGGDDCILKSWDLRIPEMVTGRCKEFEAGVTTIASSPYTEHLIAVGRYVVFLSNDEDELAMMQISDFSIVGISNHLSG